MGNLLFSIIIPVYNVERYISECLDSIINQDGEDFEIILVNDGSTDKSLEVCTQYQTKYNCIKVFDVDNGGAGYARNIGLSYSSGKYILFVDSDDCWNPGLLTKLRKIICNNVPQLIVFGYQTVVKKGLMVKHQTIAADYQTIADCNQFYYEMIKTEMIFPVWNKCFEKSIISDNNILFKESDCLYEDYLFVLEYLKFVSICCSISNIFYNYVQRNDEHLGGKAHPVELRMQNAQNILDKLIALGLPVESYGLLYANYYKEIVRAINDKVSNPSISGEPLYHLVKFLFCEIRSYGYFNIFLSLLPKRLRYILSIKSPIIYFCYLNLVKTKKMLVYGNTK